jgi:hypothetical protein
MIDKNETIYISGPMTGIADFNRPAFHAMEKILTETFGCKVLNPARITDERVNREHPGLLGRELYRTCIRYDLELVLAATGILRLAGFSNSKGAAAELAVAHCLDLRIIDECEIMGYIAKAVKQ